MRLDLHQTHLADSQSDSVSQLKPETLITQSYSSDDVERVKHQDSTQVHCFFMRFDMYAVMS